MKKKQKTIITDLLTTEAGAAVGLSEEETIIINGFRTGNDCDRHIMGIRAKAAYQEYLRNLKKLEEEKEQAKGV